MSQLCSKCGQPKSHVTHVPRGSLGRGVNNAHAFKIRRQTMNGKILRAFAGKGFGFIRGDDLKDYFFHRSDFHGFFEDLVKDVDEGRSIEVNFHSVPSNRGLRAAEVTRVDGGT